MCIYVCVCVYTCRSCKARQSFHIQESMTTNNNQVDEYETDSDSKSWTLMILLTITMCSTPNPHNDSVQIRKNTRAAIRLYL